MFIDRIQCSACNRYHRISYRFQKRNKREILHQLKEELINNKEAAKEQYAYHQQVFKLIDSAKAILPLQINFG